MHCALCLSGGASIALHIRSVPRKYFLFSLFTLSTCLSSSLVLFACSSSSLQCFSLPRGSLWKGDCQFHETEMSQRLTSLLRLGICLTASIPLHLGCSDSRSLRFVVHTLPLHFVFIVT
ncbi:hypothetical protein TGVAND_464981 [Toxoplasma gondii VAND]|uniref:Uncharacterized protein n=1 Tax=Toxoplasma gondii VAND TaxID=933077 RepID=A0A086PMZ6_TOXGO|nr:hypothetical protein TGVAND_464981 [Toxoplasma gondii VAND]